MSKISKLVYIVSGEIKPPGSGGIAVGRIRLEVPFIPEGVLADSSWPDVDPAPWDELAQTIAQTASASGWYVPDVGLTLGITRYTEEMDQLQGRPD